MDRNKDESTTPGAGELVARKYCGSCHSFPNPNLLDKQTWLKHTLPAMGYRFGIYNERHRDSLIEKGAAGKLITHLNIFPVQQTITDDDWAQIIGYYQKEAPEKLELPDTISFTTVSPFEVIIPNFNIERPAVSAVSFDKVTRKLYVADCSRENFSTVTLLDSSLKPVTSLGLPFPVSNLTARNDTLYILMMGHFIPSDEPAGQLIKAIKNAKGEYEGYKMILRGLRRPVDADYADIDADNDDDIVICEFGNHTGSLSLFLKEGKHYRKQLLMEAPGAIEAIIDDLNNDSKLDIIALMAQGDEGIDVYYNEGMGKFRRERKLQFPPVYGSVSMILRDFNGDNFKDIIYVNGDNADASRIIKLYHGIRVFLNDQNDHFTESFFYSFPGAYKAVVGDVDGDNDLDISAISFFPNFNSEPMKGFVHLENISKGDTLKFKPSLPDMPPGRWLTFTDLDINEDSRMDLLLGSFTSLDIPGDSSNVLKHKLQNESRPVILLKNHTK